MNQQSGSTDPDVAQDDDARPGAPARQTAIVGAVVSAAAALALLVFQTLTSLADHAAGGATLTFPVRGWIETIDAGAETVTKSYVALSDTESRLLAASHVLERAWPVALLVAAAVTLVLVARGRAVRTTTARAIVAVGAWQVAATVTAALLTSAVLPEIATRTLGLGDGGSVLGSVVADIDRAGSPVANLSSGHLALGLAILVVGLVLDLAARTSRPAARVETSVRY